MGGKAQQINGQGVETQRAVPHHLHRIHVKRHPGLAAAVTQRLNGLDGSHLALAPDHGDQPGGGLEQSLEGLHVHHTHLIHGNPLHLPAQPLQLISRRQGGRMFHR